MADKKQCFVISPIGDPDGEVRAEADWVLYQMIKPALEPEFEAHRADEYAPLYVITNKIITEIRNADLIVADLSGHNPNVFYELCVAHAFSKPVVPIIREGERIPFDNAPMGTIFYSRATHQKWEAAKSALRAAAQEATKPDHIVSNPITMALGSEQLKVSGDSRDQQIAQLQEDLRVVTQSVFQLMRERERPPRGLVPGFLTGPMPGLINTPSETALYQAEVGRRVKVSLEGQPIEDDESLRTRGLINQGPSDKRK